MKIYVEQMNKDEIDIIEHRINKICVNRKNCSYHAYKKMKNKKISLNQIKATIKQHKIIECDVEEDFRVLLMSVAQYNGTVIIVCVSLIDGNIVTVYKRNRKEYSKQRYQDTGIGLINLYNQYVRNHTLKKSY